MTEMPRILSKLYLASKVYIARIKNRNPNVCGVVNNSKFEFEVLKLKALRHQGKVESCKSDERPVTDTCMHVCIY